MRGAGVCVYTYCPLETILSIYTSTKSCSTALNAVTSLPFDITNKLSKQEVGGGHFKSLAIMNATRHVPPSGDHFVDYPSIKRCSTALNADTSFPIDITNKLSKQEVGGWTLSISSYCKPNAAHPAAFRQFLPLIRLPEGPSGGRKVQLALQ